jgi:hypothetical protein
MEVLSDQLSRKGVFHSLWSHCWLLWQSNRAWAAGCGENLLLVFFLLRSHLGEGRGKWGLSKVSHLIFKEILEKEIWKDVMLGICQSMNKQ